MLFDAHSRGNVFVVQRRSGIATRKWSVARWTMERGRAGFRTKLVASQLDIAPDFGITLVL